MQSLLYVSVALIAVAFSILVIYLIQTLKSLQGTLDSVTATVASLEEQLEGVTTETTELLQKTNSLAEDIQEKSDSLNSVVTAVKGVGETVHTFNESLQSVSQSVTKEVKKNEVIITQVAQVGTILYGLRDKWQEWKEHKAEKEQETGVVSESRGTEQEKYKDRSYS